jgi:hypothetical protein
MRIFPAVCVLGATVWTAVAAPFQNLGFEEANTNSAVLYWGRDDLGLHWILYGSGPTADLLPGWEVRIGERSVTTLNYNIEFGYPSFAIYDRVTLGHPLETGNRFYVQLATLTAGSPFGEPVSIVQSGLVPADAQYLSYDDTGSAGATVYPTVNGTRLSPVSQTQGHVSYDVSQYAGQEVTLALTLFPQVIAAKVDTIDSIAFEAVPEPATGVLLTLGAATLCGAIRCRRRRTVRHL